jgi:SOS-response transcriptional repressor LexA
MTGFPEHDDELLERLAAEAAVCSDSEVYEDTQFADWLARESACHQSPVQQLATERAADRYARMMTVKVTAARLATKYPRFVLHERSALVPGTFAQVTELAAQERCAPRVDLRVAAGVGRELWDEGCDAWVELPNGVPAGKYVALTVGGDSMTPLLHDGDVILVNPHAKVARDSVVVARRPDDGYVVKHVARLGRTELELASLNPAYAPFTIARDPGAIVGTLVARLGVGRVA